MKAVVTRVSSASVTIDGKVEGAIDKGYLVLLGVGPNDVRCPKQEQRFLRAETLYFILMQKAQRIPQRCQTLSVTVCPM